MCAKAKPGLTPFRGLTNPDGYQKKKAIIGLLYATVSIFLILYQFFSYILTQVRCT